MTTEYLINFGVCSGPNCRYRAERCEFQCCGKCCRRIHISMMNHTLAPPLSGERSYKVSDDEANKPPAEEGPPSVPALGRISTREGISTPVVVSLPLGPTTKAVTIVGGVYGDGDFGY